MNEVMALFAPFGPEWLLGVLVLLGVGYFGKQFLEEYKAQNRRKAEMDERAAQFQMELSAKREERKQAEVADRYQRDRERSEMDGRMAVQMERSNALIEALKTLMESVVASNEVLHNDIAQSQGRSQSMAQDVVHIRDRVDLLWGKETN